MPNQKTLFDENSPAGVASLLESFQRWNRDNERQIVLTTDGPRWVVRFAIWSHRIGETEIAKGRDLAAVLAAALKTLAEKRKAVN